MARMLTPIVLSLGLDPQRQRLREETEFADLTFNDVEIEQAPPRALGTTAWMDRARTQHRWRARLTSNAAATGYDIDDDTRYVQTHAFTASQLRDWTALELQYRETGADLDSPTATVRFVLWDGTNELWFDSGAWSTSAGAAERNTAQQAQDGFASLDAATVRTLAVRAYLDTSDASYTPYFFGALVAYKVRTIGDDDDAVLRTVLSSLRSNLSARSVLKWTTAAETSSVAVPPSEVNLETSAVVDVDAVFNLTDDPTEASALSGTYSSGTWTPDTPIAASKVVLLEYSYRPDVVVIRHRDATKLRRLPAVVLEQAGTPVTMQPAGVDLVRDLFASPPDAVEVQRPARVEVDYRVRITAEFWRDVQHIALRFREWFEGNAYRVLPSPETARLVEARLVADFANVSGVLSLGVHELRGTVRLSYDVARRDTTVQRGLVQDGGVDITTTERF